MLRILKGKQLLFTFVIVGLLGWSSGSGITAADPQCGTAQLDNDLNESDLETYCADPTMSAGAIKTEDEDGDGDFDKLLVGTQGGGSIYGWEDFDGQPEMELVVSDPTLPSARVRSADADSDGDVEVIWVGTQGLDLDKDGDFELDEAGLIAGFADIDGDGDLEIIIADKARSLGDYYVGGFGFDRENTDRFEVIWLGLLNNVQRAAAGSIVGITDNDSDGDDEICVQDIRRAPKEDAIDLDLDGDPDVLIKPPFREASQENKKGRSATSD